MTYEAVRVKLDPTPSQIRKLKSHIGGARFAYNFMLGYLEEQYEKGNKTDYSKYSIRNIWNSLKKEVAPWYKSNSCDCYYFACFNLHQAYKNFFDGCSAKRSDKPGFPKFKKKSKHGSFVIGINKIEDYRITFPKAIGTVHCFENIRKRINDRKITRCTISTDGDNWFASVLVKTEHSEYTDHKADYVGIDLGLNTLATLSDGTIIENEHRLKQKEKKLKRYQRMMSRRQGFHKGEKKSRRFIKAEKRVRKLHRKVRNQRRDTIEKATTDICKTYKNIAIEDLKVKSMTKNHKLAKSIQDASFKLFRSCLERKAEKFNSTIWVVDTFYPSSKTCSKCGEVKAKLPLSERTYVCDCGLEIDRDLNAAINLEKVARDTQETQNARGERVRRISLSQISEAQCLMKRESGNQIRPEVLISNDETSSCA